MSNSEKTVFAWVALLAGGLAAQNGPPAQTTAVERTDWDALVAKACEHRRYGMRRAIASKIGAAGDAAIGAVRAYAARAQIPLLLVDGIARAKARGPERTVLLIEWARDRDFYWRAQALGGLADLASSTHAELFRAAITDASYLCRLEGARGLWLADVDREPAIALLGDPDPRARTRAAVFLLEQGDPSGLREVAHALRREGTFLGDAWAQREATGAFRALRAFADDDFGYDASAPQAERPAALARIDAFVAERAPDAPAPRQAAADDTVYAGGVEIRSCRNGDLFLRWTADGTVAFGLEADIRAVLPSEVWRDLVADLPTEEQDRTHGVVICDYLRVVSTQPTLRSKSAPGSLPADLARWLKALSGCLEKTGRSELADELNGRLGQFAGAPKK